MLSLAAVFCLTLLYHVSFSCIQSLTFCVLIISAVSFLSHIFLVSFSSNGILSLSRLPVFVSCIRSLSKFCSPYSSVMSHSYP